MGSSFEFLQLNRSKPLRSFLFVLRLLLLKTTISTKMTWKERSLDKQPRPKHFRSVVKGALGHAPGMVGCKPAPRLGEKYNGAQACDEVCGSGGRLMRLGRLTRKVEEQHKKALEEDPSVFDYDGVFDDMKEKIARPRIQDKTERKSKYIETLMQKAKEREREHEIVYEKKLLKERSKDDHLYADKEKFVTSAYKKQLAEREKWMEEERLRQIREEKEDITKKKDLSEFYFGLNKNVAFGGGSRLVEPTKLSKPEVVVDNSAQGSGSGSATESNKVHRKSEAHYRFKSQTEHEATTSKAVTEDVTTSSQERKREGNKDKEEKLNQTEEQSNETAEVYKRSEAAVVAARERFLTRKRAREQL